MFESDISYPSNTILTVSVSSAGFSASATMDIDIKDIPTFYYELQKVYDSLKGEAKIRELHRSNIFSAVSKEIISFFKSV